MGQACCTDITVPRQPACLAFANAVPATSVQNVVHNLAGYGLSGGSWQCTCGTAVPQEAAFCHRCGSKRPPAQVVCTSCGGMVAAGAEFCGQCGCRQGGGGQVYTEEGPVFISQVGELPKFAPAPRASLQDVASDVSSGQGESLTDEALDEVADRQQASEAKKIIKNFVKTMVKGQKMSVMTQGGPRTCTVSLTRNLDAMKIKAGGQTRNIGLAQISEMHAGAEVPGIDTPLDDLCVSLMLESEDCISFCMPDIEARDTFILCLDMFVSKLK